MKYGIRHIDGKTFILQEWARTRSLAEFKARDIRARERRNVRIFPSEDGGYNIFVSSK